MEAQDAVPFSKLILLGCAGNAITQSFDELIHIGRLADCYSMQAVCHAVEWTAMKHLNVSRAAELLANTAARGMESLRQACRELALTRSLQQRRAS